MPIINKDFPPSIIPTPAAGTTTLFTDSGAAYIKDSTGTVTQLTGLSPSGVVPGTYVNPTIDVNEFGVITNAAGGTVAGTVTSVDATGANGISVSGVPITETGTIAISLNDTAVTPGTYGTTTKVAQFTVDPTGRITAAAEVDIPFNEGTVTSVAATGSSDIAVSGSPITSSGTLTFALNDTTVVAGTYGTTTNVPQITVDAKGRITTISNVAITQNPGTVTSIDATGTNGINVTGGPITSSGSLTITLADTAVTTGTYGSDTTVPQFTVDSTGRITGVTNVTISGGGGAGETFNPFLLAGM